MFHIPHIPNPKSLTDHINSVSISSKPTHPHDVDAYQILVGV